MFWRKKRSDDEFTEISETEAKSNRGFRVSLFRKGMVNYRESSISVELASEYMGQRNGIIISRKSKFNRGLSGLSEQKIAEIFDNIVRALTFLNFEIEFLD